MLWVSQVQGGLEEENRSSFWWRNSRKYRGGKKTEEDLTAFKLLFFVLYLRSALEMGNWVKVMQILCNEGGKMST